MSEILGYFFCKYSLFQQTSQKSSQKEIISNEGIQLLSALIFTQEEVKEAKKKKG